MIASAVDGAVYLAEGNYAMAAVCFLDAVIPAVGIAGKVLSTSCKYARVGKTIETGAKVANGIFNLARGMYNADKAVGNFCERHKDDLFTENFKWTKEDTLDAFSFGMAALTCVSSGKSLANDLDNFMAAGDDLATLGASVGCFVAGTLIKTSEGEKKIEDIQEGDLVLSYEASEGSFAYKEVLEVVAHEGVTELAHVTIREDAADGAYTGTETIDSTTNHPYFVVGYGFVEAGNLRPGDTILLANGENRKVDSVEIEFLDDPVTVYNFEVADWHTYFVGNTGVLVHNANIQACSDAVASAGGNGKAAGGAGEGGSKTKAFDVVEYGDKTPGLENHHGVLDVWATHNIDGYKSRASKSTTIALTKSQHDATKAVYRDWLFEKTGKRVGGKVDWKTVSPQEIQSLSERMFDAANVPMSARRNYYGEFNKYIYGLEE